MASWSCNVLAFGDELVVAAMSPRRMGPVNAAACRLVAKNFSHSQNSRTSYEWGGGVEELLTVVVHVLGLASREFAYGNQLLF